MALQLKPQFSMDKHAGFVNELLTSWKPQHSEPALELRAYDEREFTRQSYADSLRSLGTIIEAWIQTVKQPLQTVKQPLQAGEQPPLAGGGSEKGPHTKYRLNVDIYDWDAERKWWSDHLDSCFPTWARLGRLHMVFLTRECLSAGSATTIAPDFIDDF